MEQLAILTHFDLKGKWCVYRDLITKSNWLSKALIASEWDVLL